jgi:hypothetical protein
MAKQKVRYTRRGGVAKAEAYIWYVEHFATRRNAVDRTFCDAIKFNKNKKDQRREVFFYHREAKSTKIKNEESITLPKNS